MNTILTQRQALFIDAAHKTYI